jgi:hypothetical protein
VGIDANSLEHRAIVARKTPYDKRGLGLLLVVEVLDAMEILLDKIVSKVVPLIGVANDVLDIEERGGCALFEAIKEFGNVVYRRELMWKVCGEVEEAHAHTTSEDLERGVGALQRIVETSLTTVAECFITADKDVPLLVAKCVEQVVVKLVVEAKK